MTPTTRQADFDDWFSNALERFSPNLAPDAERRVRNAFERAAGAMTDEQWSVFAERWPHIFCQPWANASVNSLYVLAPADCPEQVWIIFIGRQALKQADLEDIIGHECGHLVLGHESGLTAPEDADRQEREANALAVSWGFTPRAADGRLQ